MFKTLFVSAAIMTSCASTGEPVAPRGGAVPANTQAVPASNVVFAESADKTQIAFEKVGKGPALVIVGGALSERGGGKPLASALQDRFTVYTYDRRGRGQSGNTQPYAVEREVEDLEAVIQQAGNTAYVYGVSSGAALALQAAVTLGPAKVAKLGVYEPPYGQDPNAFNQQKERVQQLVQTGKPGEAAGYFLSAIGMPPQALEDMKRSPAWESIQKIDFTLVYDYAVLGNGSVPDSVKRIAIPTLVLDGEKSMEFIHPTVDRIAEFIPHAQRKTLAGQTHQAAPEAVAPLLVEFFGGGS